MDIMQIAKQMGVKPEIVRQVQEKATSLGVFQSGIPAGDADLFKKVLNQNGGATTLDKALKLAQNPLVKVGLKKMGVDSATLDSAVAELRGISGVQETVPANAPHAAQTTTGNDIMARLHKLK